jgi:hypothetical protein
MPDRVGLSVVVKRMIPLEYERPPIGSYPSDIVFSFRTITCLCSERSLRRHCLLSLESLHEQSSPDFDRDLVVLSRGSAPSRDMTTKMLAQTNRGPTTGQDQGVHSHGLHGR